MLNHCCVAAPEFQQQCDNKGAGVTGAAVPQAFGKLLTGQEIYNTSVDAMCSKHGLSELLVYVCLKHVRGF